METLIPVNLDYAASTPLRPSALAAMKSWDEGPYAGANPSALHSLGRGAYQQLEHARRQVASSLGYRVRPHEVVFTGGGSEANRMALFGIARAVRLRDHKRCRVILSSIEHDSVLNCAAGLREAGLSVDILKVSRSGVVSLDHLEALMGPDVACVSVMLANNETGAVQPLSEISSLAHAHGALVHTDAIQAYLHVPFDVDALGVDALSLAGHKVGASVGIGALYLRHQTPFIPLVPGTQEFGKRLGTQDVRAALALGAVATELHSSLQDTQHLIQTYADELYQCLLTSPHIEPTLGSFWQDAPRVPGIVSICVASSESQDLILQLDAHGFAVSAGAACGSQDAGPSHVLRAMGVAGNLASGALRVSFDDRIDREDLVRFGSTLIKVAEQLCS